MRSETRLRLERSLRLGRRSFLRAAGGALAWLASPALGSGTRETAPEIHRATRNTRLGTIGQAWPRLSRPPRPGKTYPGAERLRLPRIARRGSRALAEVVRGFDPALRFGPEPISLAELTWLLHYSNGVTFEGETRLRAAPSAGALYAGELYVLAERVEGLPQGAYYYDVLGHALVSLRTGSAQQRVAQALESPTHFENAAAVVLLSNVFGRYTWRYANRGYRYALIDSGHIGENLRLAARSAGLAEASALRFRDDLLNQHLELDGRGEAVCALHAIGRKAASAAPHPDSVPRRFVEAQEADASQSSRGQSLILRYHEATKLVPGSSKSAGDTEPSAPPGPVARDSIAKEVATDALALGEPRGGPSRSVADCILSRRSSNRFSPPSLVKPALAFLIEMAQGHIALERSPGLSLFVFAHRVDGVAPGLYLYTQKRRTLALVRAGDLRETLVDVCLGQRKAGSAAVGFAMAARLEPGLGLGDRRYRDRLLEAGSVGERIYLAAEAMGLGARNLAAFLDDDLNALLGLDGHREAVVHLTMAGAER